MRKNAVGILLISILTGSLLSGCQTARPSSTAKTQSAHTQTSEASLKDTPENQPEGDTEGETPNQTNHQNGAESKTEGETPSQTDNQNGTEAYENTIKWLDEAFAAEDFFGIDDSTIYNGCIHEYTTLQRWTESTGYYETLFYDNSYNLLHVQANVSNPATVSISGEYRVQENGDIRLKPVLYTLLNGSTPGTGTLSPTTWVYKEEGTYEYTDTNNSSHTILRLNWDDIVVDNGENAIGSIIAFGTDPYSSDPILWRIVDQRENAVMVVSEYFVRADGQWYTTEYQHSGWDTLTWETSDMRTFLNHRFIQNSFSQSEQAAILETSVEGTDNPYTGADGGNDTVDRVFLLSVDEALHYFSDADRMGYNPEGINGSWWLRTPGYGNSTVAVIWKDGQVYDFGGFAPNDTAGVRPAMWLDTEKMNSIAQEEIPPGEEKSAAETNPLEEAENAGETTLPEEAENAAGANSPEEAMELLVSIADRGDIRLWIEVQEDALIMPFIEEYKQTTGEDLSTLSRHEQIQILYGDYIESAENGMEGQNRAYGGRMVSEEEFLLALDNMGVCVDWDNPEKYMAELREICCTDTLNYCILYDSRDPGTEEPCLLGYYEDTGKWIPIFSAFVFPRLYTNS